MHELTSSDKVWEVQKLLGRIKLSVALEVKLKIVKLLSQVNRLTHLLTESQSEGSTAPPRCPEGLPSRANNLFQKAYKAIQLLSTGKVDRYFKVCASTHFF